MEARNLEFSLLIDDFIHKILYFIYVAKKIYFIQTHYRFRKFCLRFCIVTNRLTKIEIPADSHIQECGSCI